MEKIFQVFINEKDMGIQRILKLVDIATARSAFTGEYLKAIDVAAAVIRGWRKNPNEGAILYLARKVSEVRHIIAQAESPLPYYYFAGGVYKEASILDRPGFPLELPAKEAGHERN